MSSGALSFLQTVVMSLEADQFTQLMNAVTTMKDGIEANFTAKLDKFQYEVEASQAAPHRK